VFTNECGCKQDGRVSHAFHFRTCGSPQSFMLSPRVQRTISEATYAFFVLIIAVASILTCAALISQAVRTSPSKSWTKNFNALIIGAAYIILVRVNGTFTTIETRTKVPVCTFHLVLCQTEDRRSAEASTDCQTVHLCNRQQGRIACCTPRFWSLCQCHVHTCLLVRSSLHYARVHPDMFGGSRISAKGRESRGLGTAR